MKKIGLFALAVFLSTSAAMAAEPAAEAPKEEKKICRSEPMTGSRTRFRKICKTEAEWREIAMATRTGMNKMENRVASGVTQGN